MRIGIDAQTTLGQKTGFGFYVENLTKSLNKNAAGDRFQLFLPQNEEDLSTPQRWWWDQVLLPKLLRKHDIDVFHQPAFSAPILHPGKTVVTIHDVISLFYTDIPFFSRQYYSKWMPFSYRFADHFITISEHSKSDIVSKLHIPEEKITVTYLATDREYQKEVSKENLARVRQKYHLEKPYILNVGTINPRKNLEFLVNVYARLKRDNRIEHQLAIAGKKGWHYDQLFALVKKLGLENDVLFLGYVDDIDKPALYHGADLFAFPSVYEGFGLPPLEAMTCGVPVVSSNTSSLPEVIGEGGIQLAPTDEGAWVEACARVLTDNALQRELRHKAVIQANMFSWDRCAKETLKVYQAVTETSTSRKN